MNRVSFSYVKEMHPALERSLGLLRSFLYFSVIYLLVTGFLPAIFVEAAEQKNAESSKPPLPPSPPPAPATIPLADIATRATEVSNLLGNLTATAPNAQIESIAKTLPELSEKLDAQFLATTKMLEAAPTLETLQNEQQQWQSAQLQSTGWLNALTHSELSLSQVAESILASDEFWAKFGGAT